MSVLQRLSDLIVNGAARAGTAPALRFEGRSLTYQGLADAVDVAARGLLERSLQKGDRVAVYLETRFETVIALFAAALAGAVFVPVNPLLKPRQVHYVLRDCSAGVLVTSRMRLESLRQVLSNCPDLELLVLVDAGADGAKEGIPGKILALAWADLLAEGSGSGRQPRRVIDSDVAAILYTSGSTGMPKGVVLSHRNLLVGAQSVNAYLEHDAEDRILAVLPLSFDAGLSQLTTGFDAGATVVLMNYLVPKDVLGACAEERVTGLTCVPPLWIKLAELDWPEAAAKAIRYFANTGGHMPRATLDRLRAALPKAKPYLMYGLTESFRSTYLDPKEVDRRPESIGQAIPNAEIQVVREDGSLCEAGEIGELVHRGPLVALGYWNDPEGTAERFRPAPEQPQGLPGPEIAVWSGDQVRMDEEGFLYFVGRSDDMIKTSGYRVSPTELEEVLYASGAVGEAVAFGIAHPVLGQAVVVVATPPVNGVLDTDLLLDKCRNELPAYMVPQRVIEWAALPRTANGKVDRRLLRTEFAGLFSEASP